VNDPGRHLLQHKAPSGLLEAARLRAVSLERPRSWAAPLALAAGLLLGLSGGYFFWAGSGPVVVEEQAVPAVAEVAVAPQVDSPVSTRLVCYAPGAETVAVAGSFNRWDPSAAPMRPLGDGLFATDLVLPRGRHEYMFVLDEVEWVGDPSAPLAADDGFGQQNSVLEI